ncbi:hypothetical protein EHW66_16450 [Erwinia psidii]|uniref:hypothetical protein n=1 Tax=Erwinia psidii TaxID=69224 RepID=UPI00226B5D7B|nr:hypothetical protein [Erwinia psidii]MCX8966510.1 hypothetical protein [Erwinia psidii]
MKGKITSALVLLFLSFASHSQGNVNSGNYTGDISAVSLRTNEYWTKARMLSAKPMPTVQISAGEIAFQKLKISSGNSLEKVITVELSVVSRTKQSGSHTRKIKHANQCDR